MNQKWIHLVTAFGLMAACVAPAMAESALPTSPESNSISNIMKVIGNVSLVQSDQNAAQAMLEILDMKSQMLDQKKPAAQLAVHARRVPAKRRTKTF